MAMNYQRADSAMFDYGMVKSHGVAHRGPVPMSDDPRCIAIGSAHTFGRFCRRAYPGILYQDYGLRIVNMGLSGAGPETFLAPDFDFIRKVPTAIVQVMSSRSVENSVFGGFTALKTLRISGLRITGKPTLYFLRNKKSMTADLGDELPEGLQLPAKIAWQEFIAQSSVDHVQSLVEETRNTWVQKMIQLIQSFEGRTILFWFSERAPDYDPDYQSVEGVFNAFPQLVNREMVDMVREQADDYTELVTNTDMPEKLPPLRPGQSYPLEVANGKNKQYPSQAMQFEAAAHLASKVFGVEKT